MIGGIKNFRFWCQKVLPLVYDNSLSYYEILCKVVHYLNHVIDDMNQIPEYIDEKVKEAMDDEHIKELISEVFRTLEDAISADNEGTNTNFSKDYPDLGTLLWHDNKLYQTIRKIDEGDVIIPDVNIELVNFGDMFKSFIDEVKGNFTTEDDGLRETSSKTRNIHQLVWLNDVLYEVIKPIAEGNAYIYTGENKNVEPTNLDSIFNYIINLIENEIEAAIEAEAEARASADEALSDDISGEETARTNADLALEDLIASEVTARYNADEVIRALVETETTNRENADTALSGAISDEATVRANADATLLAKINAIHDRRVVILTDSYGNVPAGNTFYNIFLNLTGMVNNNNAFLFAYNGCGFVGNTNSWQNAFVASGDIDTVTNRDTITDVYVLGGCNDVNQAELDVLEAGQTLFNSLRLKFQKANIYLGMFGQTLNPATLDKWQLIKNCYDNMNLYGYQVISGASTWLRYESYFSDYNHPNANGARYLGKALFNHFKNRGDAQLKYNRPVAATVTGSGLAASADAVIMNINTTINNDVIEAFTTGTCRISKSTGMTLSTNGTDNELATITYSFMLGGTDNSCTAPVVCQLDASGTYYTTVGMIKIYKGKIYLSLYPVNGGTSITVQHIRMLPFKLISNSMSL